MAHWIPLWSYFMTWSTLATLKTLMTIYSCIYPVSILSTLTMIHSHSAGTVLVVPWGRGWQRFHSVSVWSNSCGVQTRTPVPGSVPWWRLCAPSWACCLCLSYSSRPGTLKWKTEHFPTTAESPGEGRKNKKKFGGVWQTAGAVWNKNNMNTRRLGVPISFYYRDIVFHPVVLNTSKESAPRQLYSIFSLFRINALIFIT